MRTRTIVALLTSVLGGLAVVGGGLIGARAGVRGQRAAAQRVVDMLPVHADWWRERLQHEGQLTYLAIGDSAAQGVGATTPARGYVGLLARRIRHRSRMSVRVVNLSVSGSTTWGAKNDQLPKLRNHTPDICTVSIGANDIADFHPDKFERNIRAIYSAVPSHAIVAELPCMFVPDRERKVAVANEIVHRVADELGLTVAPLHVITKRVGLRRTFFNSYGDLFHPNDRGYEIWASAFEPAVDARVDTVAAIRQYLSAREAEDLGREAGAVATARAEQDTEHAAELDHSERPGRVERLRHRMTGSIPLPHQRDVENENADSTSTSTGTGTGTGTGTTTTPTPPRAGGRVMSAERPSLDVMARTQSLYRCSECGWTSIKWVGRCGECQAWGTVEDTTAAAASSRGTAPVAVAGARVARPITQATGTAVQRWNTGIGEFDRVLGGGIVPGAAVLLSGEPGVGKSTLLLEVASRAAATGKRVLYVSAEESVDQVRLRAERTNAMHDELYLASEVDLGVILGQIDQVQPDLVIADSVQTISSSTVDGIAGGTSQVREVASTLIRVAKERALPVLIVGHVTKDGTIAGPGSSSTWWTWCATSRATARPRSASSGRSRTASAPPTRSAASTWPATASTRSRTPADCSCRATAHRCPARASPSRWRDVGPCRSRCRPSWCRAPHPSRAAL